MKLRLLQQLRLEPVLAIGRNSLLGRISPSPAAAPREKSPVKKLDAAPPPTHARSGWVSGRALEHVVLAATESCWRWPGKKWSGFECRIGGIDQDASGAIRNGIPTGIVIRSVVPRKVTNSWSGLMTIASMARFEFMTRPISMKSREGTPAGHGAGVRRLAFWRWPLWLRQSTMAKSCSGMGDPPACQTLIPEARFSDL